ncbi:MAG: aminotransferase class IV [Anaerolineales bacterium]|nr:aminotransferase class IV [Anaerolineales bacterium]MDW8277696.1 aminotransferase class IV [Anaerolineales bacterium]
MLTVYTLTPDLHALGLPDVSSLDAVSRQLPQGLYSTFRTYAGRTKVLGLEMHLHRLYDPLPALGIRAQVSPSELRAALREGLRDFPAQEARVRVTVSTTEGAGMVFMALEPLKAPDETVYQRGVRVILSPVERKTPRLKTTSFIGESDSARQMLLQSGAYEALMTRNGRILEGLTSNFYAVKNGVIITAREGILLGVTRRYVLRLARSNGIGIEYRPPRVEELPTWDEAFITSSGRGVVPVTEVAGQPVGTGQVGEIARLLRRVYDEYVVKKAERI